MTVYAIADLHLPAGTNKPMDIFGAHWERHFERISEDWRARVTEEDIVLLPGDISWAMRLEDACMDLDAIGRLPGVKILTRGNHDYWWSSISRVREKLTGNTHALQNDAMKLGGRCSRARAAGCCQKRIRRTTIGASSRASASGLICRWNGRAGWTRTRR